MYFELCPLFNNIINPRIIIIGYKYYIINTDPLFQELLLCGVCSWSPGLRGEDGGHSEQPLPGLACLPGHASGTVHQHRLVVGPRGYGERMEATVSSLCLASPVFQAMLQVQYTSIDL